MPMYEYRCPKCHATFELLQPMARATEPAVCPDGHRGAERIVSLVAARPRSDPAGQPLPAGGGCACGGGGCGCAG